MAKNSKSSRKWLDEHFSDHYVKRSQAEGWRSRAVYKLEEIDKKDRLIKPKMNVVDLGAAPGGWSQYAARAMRERGGEGRVFALDILPMASIAGVEFIEGDFREAQVLDQLLAMMGNVAENQGADLVLSDMAPNTSGVAAVDLPRAMYLCELAMELAVQVLKPEGRFLVKVFQGQGFEDYLRDMRSNFSQVITRKPQASRSRSREIYLLASKPKRN
ncbi:MAG: 23S rRNA (uridine(2552)-2'-O)-methyltransferase RlmE [Gammaproteobacteria bacterium]|nr:23S rRNA (uridine(2552)-2'-O)-methyltransferase RlmE [Gammaproteobacteria bacterium]